MQLNKIDQLLYYIRQGWPIFPLHSVVDGKCTCKKPSCQSPGKHPRLTGGFKVATLDEELVRDWHHKWANANWGMRTGSTEHGGSGVMVVDIDAKNNGFDSWEFLVAQNPDRDDTVTVLTGRLGLHYWFQYPDDMAVGNNAGKLGAGLDIRADRGYVVVPPSVTTHPYEFKLTPGEFEIIPPPAWLMQELRNLGSRSHLDLDEIPSKLVPQGKRHHALLSFGAALRGEGMAEELIRSSLHAFRDKCFADGDHPVSDAEVGGVLDWIMDNAPPHHFTDKGNALRFFEQHGEEVIFCFDRGQWIVWNSIIWAINDTANALLRGMETVKTIHTEAARLPESEDRANLKKHALRSEASSKLDAMMSQVKVLTRIGDRELDQFHDHIPVRNGVLHLPTGDLLPHNKDFYFTRFIDIDYVPGAGSPAWLSFLEMVTQGNQELVGYLQKAVGYTLTGRIDEQSLFYIHGDGANGKSTFVEALRRMMGRYAERVGIDALMETYHSRTGPKPEIARINGARMVLTTEVPFNKRLNEALVKELTGGDAITARGLYQSDQTFYPTYKLYVVGNYEPNIVGTDEGILRRFNMIPFDYRIPKNIRKPWRLVMDEFESEMEGILAWAVEGAIHWYAEGLDRVSVVETATSDFREDQDLVGQFLDEKCIIGEDLKVAKVQLYQVWRRWCEVNGEFEGRNRTQRWLSTQIIKKGFETYGSGKKTFSGLGILNNHY